jgi:hypothetical protein
MQLYLSFNRFYEVYLVFKGKQKAKIYNYLLHVIKLKSLKK